MFIQDYLSQEEELDLLVKAIESARNGIVITDPKKADNPIVYTNPAFSRITGYGASEILGKNCRFLQGVERGQPGLAELRLAIKEERSVSTTLVNFRKDGSKFYNELTVSPVRNREGQLIAFVGVQNDISARIEAEQRISDFYSVVSHELRNPIAKIKSSLSVIADGEAGPINEQVKRFVEISLSASETLWRLIENILDLKRLESGEFRLRKKRIDLAELAQNVVQGFAPVFSQSDMELECKPDNSVRFFVDADPQLLKQVLDNLLSNAVKFSPAGSKVEIGLSFSIARQSQQLEQLEPSALSFVRVEVKDQGIGISEFDKTRLFEKFRQLEPADNRQRGGSGLGLSICKAIVEAHGGNIGVESRKPAGSIFWFQIPAAKDAANAGEL